MIKNIWIIYVLLATFYLFLYHIFIIKGYQISSIYCIDSIFSNINKTFLLSTKHMVLAQCVSPSYSLTKANHKI